MKLVIAFALLGLSAQIGDLQARETANFFKPWRSAQGQNQTTVPSTPDKFHQQRPYRQSHHNSDRRHSSLHRADEKVQRLERQKANVFRVLKRARKLHASNHKIRKIKRSLHRVNEQLHQARRDYRYLLHAHSGTRRPQHWQLTSLHNTHRKPNRLKQSSGLSRPKYQWR